jgi:hypothetical protein
MNDMTVLTEPDIRELCNGLRSLDADLQRTRERYTSGDHPSSVAGAVKFYQMDERSKHIRSLLEVLESTAALTPVGIRP